MPGRPASMMSGEGPPRLAATALLILVLALPRIGHTQSTDPEINPGASSDSATATQARSATVATTPWQSVGFSSSGLQVLSGNLELLMATWATQCQELRQRSGSGGNVQGMVFQRNLVLDQQNGKLYSRLVSFGPLWATTGQSSTEEVSGRQMPSCSLLNPVALADLPHGVPDRFTWWGRLTVPIVWAGGVAEQSHFLEQVLTAADRFHWVLETQTRHGEWAALHLDADNLERSFQSSWQTQEDWYFNPQNFSLHARVLALVWQDAAGKQFRYRLREG